MTSAPFPSPPTLPPFRHQHALAGELNFAARSSLFFFSPLFFYNPTSSPFLPTYELELTCPADFSLSPLARAPTPFFSPRLRDPFRE